MSNLADNGQQSGRKRRVKKPEEGSPLWMVTYSDMVTLLLTFFILLYSISVIDVERFQKVIISIQTSFMGFTGIMDQNTDPYESEGDSMSYEEGFFNESAMLERAREAEEILAQVEAFITEMGLEGQIELRIEERGIVMELPDYIFFERARADLRPEARDMLDQFSELFLGLGRHIIVEGHTCNLPINVPEFPSNWELSVIRAVRVTRYLIEEKGLDPQRITATGYGEFQPLEPNTSPEARARNRRVTMVIALYTPERYQEAY
jgi:chemotaxis protein MotB